jgi:CBS domain-containing protein
MKVFKYYQAKDIMTHDPIMVRPEDKLSDAGAIFERYALSELPVVDDKKNLLGVITELDLLKACLSKNKKSVSYYPSIMRQKISEVMSIDPYFVHTETTLTSVLQQFIDTGRTSFPVLEGKHIVGIVSRKEVLIALNKAALAVIPARLIAPDLKGFIEPTSIERNC